MDTKISLVGKGVLEKVGQTFVEAFGHPSALLIADGNTLKVGGFAVARSLEKAGIEVKMYVFQAVPKPYADEKAIERVRIVLSQDNSVAVVLGSGTLNDVAKRASYELGRPYMVVATAPSVDGYTSSGAAVSIDHFKKTLSCSAPAVVLADTEILCNAPSDMIASGYGDCMAKFPAGMDWILADLLGVHPIRSDVWDMVQKPLRQTYKSYQAIAQRNPEGIGLLFDALSASGYAMQVMNDSRPASGAEHLVSHIWEMAHLCCNGEEVSHGFKVAVGTIAMVHLYEQLLSMDASELLGREGCTWEQREAEIRAAFPEKKVAEEVIAVSKAKFLEGDALYERRKKLFALLPELKKRIGEQLPTTEALRACMRKVGCPVHPSQIGSTIEEMKTVVTKAQMIRNRYTILDFYYDLGILERAVESLEALIS